jgi:hypothetical protein
MNAYYAIDYEHDKQWDYSFIDRLFERLEEMG